MKPIFKPGDRCEVIGKGYGTVKEICDPSLYLTIGFRYMVLLDHGPNGFPLNYFPEEHSMMRVPNVK